MSNSSIKYIKNSHKAPITCNTRDPNTKRVTGTFKLDPYIEDKWSGRVVSSGYTKITEEQLDSLTKTSRTFVHYKDNLKLLSVVDEIPGEFKAPHEAVADARREAKKYKAELEAVKAELAALKASIGKEGGKGKKGKGVSVSNASPAPEGDIGSE